MKISTVSLGCYAAGNCVNNWTFNKWIFCQRSAELDNIQN